MSEEGAEGVPLNQTGNVATTAAAPSSNAEISTASSSVVGEGESSTTTGLLTSNQKMFPSLAKDLLEDMDASLNSALFPSGPQHFRDKVPKERYE